MAELSSKYELSVWEDVNADWSTNGLGYFTEKKLAVIGADNSQNKIFAYDISLNENINGEKTLTFSLPSKYRNEEGDLLDNPLLTYLAAERKVKLRDGEYLIQSSTAAEIAAELEEEDTDKIWYDFIVKDITEDSEKYTVTYTCKEVHVNELGKNGYSVLLDDTLGNNYGTLKELGERALDGSGWKVEVEGEVYERVNEPLFECSLSNDYDVSQTWKALSKQPEVDKLSKNDIVYTFYSQLEYIDGVGWKLRQDQSEHQFIYNRGSVLSQYDDQYIVVDDEDINYVSTESTLKGLTFNPVGVGNAITEIAIQGGRFVNSQSSIYEPTADRQVLVYTDKNNNEPVYAYATTDFLKPTLVNNLLANSYDFVNTTGWLKSQGEVKLITFPLVTYDPANNTVSGEPHNYLVPGIQGQVLYNEGLQSNKIEPIAGAKYCYEIEIDGASYNGQQWEKQTSSGGTWTAMIGYLDSSNTFTAISNSTNSMNSDVLTITSQVSGYDKTIHKLVLYLKCNTDGVDSNGNYIENKTLPCIKSILLYERFDYETVDDQGNTIQVVAKPGTAVDIKPIIKYVAYTLVYGVSGKTINQTATWKENESAPTNLVPVSNNYGAVRHLNVKESNYFNIANNLAELFGRWVSFDIKHRKNGKILLDADGIADKTIRFSRYHGNDYLNNAGFKYGINEKGIKRANDSKSIVTRLIVRDNINEHAENGICSIKTAMDNPTGDSYIYNFNYYINHGILKHNEVMDDLYGVSGSNSFNYYNKIADLMKLYAPIEQQLVAAEGALTDAKTGLENTKVMISKTEDSITNQLYMYQQYLDIYTDYTPSADQHPKCQATLASISALQAQIASFKASLKDYEAQIAKYNNLIYGVSVSQAEDFQYKGMYYPEGVTLPSYSQWFYYNQATPPTNLQKLVDGPLAIAAEAFRREKQDIEAKFYAKYSRYIQEGTWTDSQYIDANLYYLDAKKVADQNAYPKTTYTISVMDVSSADKFKHYKFKVGQRTYVEDPEFFGYVPIKYGTQQGTILTPVKKEVIISEYKRSLDNPSKSTITVKTYKNQFEDLFSKITATTQSLANASGGYQRAANQFGASGSINISSLQNALNNNAWVIGSGATNQDVEWDKGNGITVTDLKNSLLKTRLTAGGFAMTTDGGATWINGINADGINTSQLTAGTITTDQIKITSPTRGGNAFLWDEDGIDAYSEQGANKYVRFNQYGIYGTTKGYELDSLLKSASTTEAALDLIKANSNFALTWDGLDLSYQNHSLALDAIQGLNIYSGWKYQDQGNGDKHGYISGFSSSGQSCANFEDGDELPIATFGAYALHDGTEYQTYYGILFRNKWGDPTFYVKDDGSVQMTNASVTGEINATSGTIQSALKIGAQQQEQAQIGGNWAFQAGLDASGNNPKFSISHDGRVVAKDITLEDAVTATGGTFNKANIVDATIIEGTITKANINEGIVKDATITKGTITEATITKAIIQQTYFSPTDTVSFIGLPTGSTSGNYINIKNAFTVDDNGVINAQKLILQDGKILIDPDNNYFIAKDSNDNEVLTIKNDGLTVRGNVTSTEYTPGSKGWFLNSNGDAEFNNVYIRGTLDTVVFNHKQVSTIGGQLELCPTAVIGKNYTVSNGAFDATDELAGSDAWQSVHNIQIINPDDNSNQSAVLNYNSNNKSYTIFGLTLAEVKKGFIISASVDTNVNKITLNAVNKNGPQIILGGASRVVLGAFDQNDISKQYFTIEGVQYGLYAQNAFIEGKLYLPNAGITNDGDTEDSVRIWAGEPAEKRNEAPFRITQNGSLYASKGVFSGTIEANGDSVFSGTITAAGVSIKDIDGQQGSADGHFYFYLKDREGTTPISWNDYIADFDKYGLNIWNGSLSIFSKTRGQSSKYVPAFNSETDWNNHWPKGEQPWPLLSFTQPDTQNQTKAWLNTTGHMVWQEDGATSSGVRIKPKSIGFVSRSGNFSYANTASQLWEAETTASIDISKIANSFQDALRIMSTLPVSIQDTLIIEPKGMSIQKNLDYGSFKISKTDTTEGLVFHYTGDD